MSEVKIVPITGAAVTGEPYEGEYSVTPSRDAKVLETANKVMNDNVTVLAIPFAEVSNFVGGTTYYIARENE